MVELARTLADARRRAGLAQHDVAAGAGVDQAMVSRYERGRREPTWPTYQRLIAATGAVAVVRVADLPRDPGTMSISELGAYLTEARSETTRRRLALDFLGRFAASDPHRRVALLLAEPGSTGEPHWDALLAGLAEHLAFHDGWDAPDWVFEPARFLDTPWYFVDLPSARGRADASSPTAFRRRNVWIDRSDLERV
ncbi:MAG: helix-turn-helix domain-containing protein [Sporichthyaceae bacterium]